MSVHKNTGNVDKVLQLRQHMEYEKIEMDVRIYNTIAAVHRKAQQWIEAINVAKEVIKTKKQSTITVKHLLESKIEMIKITDDFRQRKEILRYIESDVVRYFEECDEVDYMNTGKFADRMLDAYVSTYGDAMGAITFEEFSDKYNLQYWQLDKNSK
eukprot:301566_1